MSSRKLSERIALIITLVLLVGSVHTTPVDATEPSDMTLVYDFGTQILSVNISHYSPSIKNHYIENIEVLKNGVSLLNRSYPNQSVDWGVYDTFSVSAVVDDNLTVTAFCSKGYSLTKWLIVISGTSTNPPATDTSTSTTEPTESPEPSDQPVGAGVAIAVSIGVVVFLIVFFAWLNPEKIPESIRQLGSRIRPGVDWLGEKLSNIIQQVRAKVPSKK
jgi:hypothetical protein